MDAKVIGSVVEVAVPNGKKLDRDALRALVAPFKATEVRWRVGSTTKDKTKGSALAYVDGRAVMHRLDDVFGPAGWSFETRPVSISATNRKGETVLQDGFTGRLTVEWPSGRTSVKEDVGSASDIEPLKGAVSDALKRVAVMVGVGRYLYALPAQWVALKDGKYLAETPRLPAWALPKPR